METIFCAFPVFAPSESQKNRNLDAIKSLIEFLKVRPDYLTGEKEVKLDIWFAGYAYKDEFWQEIKALVNSGLSQAKIFRFDKNYGKARVVNKLVENYLKVNPNTQFMLTTDSDMKFIPDQPEFFERLVLSTQVMQTVTRKPFGMVSLNQAEENCHWLDKFDQRFEYDIQQLNIKEKISWPSNASGIAGGALFLSLKAWGKIGGYKTFDGPYAGDDAFILISMAQNGFCYGVTEQLSMVHPVTVGDQEYIKWKQDQIKTSFTQPSKEGNLQYLIKDKEFWDRENILVKNL